MKVSGASIGHVALLSSLALFSLSFPSTFAAVLGGGDRITAAEWGSMLVMRWSIFPSVQGKQAQLPADVLNGYIWAGKWFTHGYNSYNSSLFTDIPGMY